MKWEGDKKMSEFKIIETQEQLDAIIGDRVARAEKKGEEKALKQYADYDDLKKQLEAQTAKVEELNSQLSAQTENASTSAKELEDLKTQLHKYETDSVKTRVAHEEGLPFDLAARLSGDDEESIRADAKALAELVGKSKPAAPLGNPEPVVKGNDRDSALREMLTGMKGD